MSQTLEERIAALEAENREIRSMLVNVTGLLRRITYAEVIRAERWGEIAKSPEIRHLQAADTEGTTP